MDHIVRELAYDVGLGRTGVVVEAEKGAFGVQVAEGLLQVPHVLGYFAIGVSPVMG